MPESVSKDPTKMAALASDPCTPVETLAELAKSGLVFLREDVARHPNAIPELLQSLMPTSLENNAGCRVAAALAANPDVPGSVLATLIRLINPELVNAKRRENWMWEDLAVKLLSHANCPETDAVAFLQSAGLPRGIKVRIAESSSTEGILKVLMADRSEAVRRAAVARLKRQQSGSSDNGA